MYHLVQKGRFAVIWAQLSVFNLSNSIHVIHITQVALNGHVGQASV